MVKEKKSVWLSVVTTMGLITMIVVIFSSMYIIWNASTMELSAQVECKVSEMEYVNLSGDGECMFLMASSESENESICGLPKDFHCKGLMQDFPIARLVIEEIIE